MTPVDAIAVLYDVELGNQRVVAVGCPDLRAWTRLPVAVDIDGVVLGLTGWHSDLCQAYYKTGVALAIPVRGRR
jgi:hypothetical protein